MKKRPSRGLTSVLEPLLMPAVALAIILPLLTGCGLFSGAAPVVSEKEDPDTLDPEGERIEGTNLFRTVEGRTGFRGGVVADEPQAALVARDVLDSGGSAGDAAAAAGLALAVTLPGSAGLASHGLCLVHDVGRRETFWLDFLNRPRAGVEPPKGAVPPPGMLRGMAALHARYGRLPWSRAVGPAERLARFGSKVSRALIRDFQASAFATSNNDITQAYLDPKTKQPLKLGETLVQPQLAELLTQVRIQGVGAFYLGSLGRAFVTSANAAGAQLTAKDLRDFRPVWRPSLSVKVDGDRRFHFPGNPVPGGIVAGQMISMLLSSNAVYAGADLDERYHFLAEAAKRAQADISRWRTPDGRVVSEPSRLVGQVYLDQLADQLDDERATPIAELNNKPAQRADQLSSSSLVVIDFDGQAVACNFTMGRPYGTGRIAKDFGVVLPVNPTEPGAVDAAFSPVILTSDNGRIVFTVVAASGGREATTSLVKVLLDSTSVHGNVDRALSSPRVHHDGVPDQVAYELGVPTVVLEGLRRRGHSVRQTSFRSRVNVILCPTGIPSEEVQKCAIQADPRGAGLASESG